MKLLEIVTIRFVNPDTVFSELEQEVFYTLLVDEPGTDDYGFEDETHPLAKLIPTQKYVDGYKSDNYNPIRVAERKGKLYIIDGHHRYTRDRKQKVEQVACAVIHLPDEHVEDLGWFERKLKIRLKRGNGVVRYNGRLTK